MQLYNTFILIFAIAVGIAYINFRFIKLQTTIAIMSAALILSFVILVLGNLGFKELEQHATQMLSAIDFNKLLLDGMLSFLLFAGALTVDLNYLSERKWEIAILATLSTIASAALIGLSVYYIFNLFLAHHLPLIYCLLFGALISPTDPIAVLATVKELKAPRELATTIAGESLFNDGVGIVIFLTLYRIAFTTAHPTWHSVSLLFIQEAFGGALYGIVLGYLAYWLIRPINNHTLEILITLVIVTGGYALALMLDISGPIAMVVAGIFIGNHGRRLFMSKDTCQRLDTFWELIDEILNVVLFLLIGLELLVIKLSYTHMLIGLAAIPLVLLVRFITVSIPINCFKIFRNYIPYFIMILTWGGLRGGLAVAMALAIPPSHSRDIILAMTYGVVVFSIVIQGTTAKSLVRRSNAKRII